MAIAPGTRIGVYDVVAQIGAGGMGEVYRAHDTRLNRYVALKVLPEAFSHDTERMGRFEREAKVLASLNHTNIAAIYGFEESGPVRALVMELVEGPTLADRIQSGAIPVDEALPIARQVADAVEYAHDKNIIHRDLKPANVKVTADGTVKVLDFGLAKALSEEVAAEDMSNSPTLSMAATQQGVILGTAAYMSPEQAKGKVTDRRTDVWAFGALLYEMLTGKQAFGGNDVTEVLASVLKSDPALEALPSKTPSAIRTLVCRCLEKTLRRRLSHIGEARMILEDVLSGAVIDAPAAARRKGVFGDVRLARSFAAAFLVAALVLAIVYLRPHGSETPVLQVSVLPPEKASFEARSVLAVAPDGRRVAFVALMDGKDVLWVRDLDSLTPRPLPGTEGALQPFWSPDSRFLGFFANGKLKKIDVAGGPALPLCDAPGGQTGYGGSWSKNDVIVFSPNNAAALLRVPAAGGASTPATTLEPGGVTHRFPWFLPDGHRFLYLDRNNDPGKSGIYIGDLDSQTKRQVVAVLSNVVYTPGRLLFLRSGVLMSQPFDIDKGQANGDPVPVAEQVGFNSGGIIGQGQFSASQNGVVAYISGSSGGAQPTRFDRAGKVVSVQSVPGTVIWNTVSPDGNTIAEDHPDGQTGIYDLWLHDLKRGAASRFTFNSRNNRFPVWSPDGSHIAFASNDGNYNLYQKASSGTGQDEALDKDARPKRPDDWSRDGRYIIEETSGDPKTGYDIWILPLTGDRKAFPYLQTRFNEHHAKLSPDGHWLAYVSDETNRDEIYVQSFPTPGGKWQVSTNGGGYPVWSRDGKELFFIGADQKLISVQVKNNVVNGSAQFEAGGPQPLFDTRLVITVNTWFDVSKDGQFVIPALPEQASNVPMTVVVNWTAGLKK